MRSRWTALVDPVGILDVVPPDHDDDDDDDDEDDGHGVEDGFCGAILASPVSIIDIVWSS